MIFVSSTCSKHNQIGNAVAELAENGFQHIELSGGTIFYDNYVEDLLNLKEKYTLTYLIHNYFPPPKTEFVLNLASLDDAIFNMSIRQLERALKLACRLGVKKLGFHAGFYLEIGLNEIGGTLLSEQMNDKRKAYERFCHGYNVIKQQASGIELYIENNVISQENYFKFGSENPLMLTAPEDFRELSRDLNFKLLLDIAHLNVSSKALGFDFISELTQLAKKTDYFHLSDNDGFRDQNKAIDRESIISKSLKQIEIMDKTVTLEIYASMSQLKKSYDVVNEIIGS